MIGRLCAAVPGAVLALSGGLKITSFAQWREQARAQRVWPLVATVIPFAELVLGACLVALPLSPVVMGLSTTMLLVFTVFLAVQVKAGSTVPCACFGTRSTKPPSGRDVLRNVALIALLAVAAALG